MAVTSSEIDGRPRMGRVLRARFRRTGQLVEHDVLVCHEGIEHCVATAEQEATVGNWPLNPPLQSWQLAEDHGGSPLLLATGLAGRSHWSLAVSLTKPGGLLFDVACRVDGEPAFLGSTYRLDEKIPEEIEVCSGGSAIILPTTRVSFHPVAGSGYGTRASSDTDHWTIQLCPTGDFRGGPTTVRWAYELKIEPT